MSSKTTRLCIQFTQFEPKAHKFHANANMTCGRRDVKASISSCKQSNSFVFRLEFLNCGWLYVIGTDLCKKSLPVQCKHVHPCFLPQSLVIATWPLSCPSFQNRHQSLLLPESCSSCSWCFGPLNMGWEVIIYNYIIYSIIGPIFVGSYTFDVRHSSTNTPYVGIPYHTYY